MGWGKEVRLPTSLGPPVSPRPTWQHVGESRWKSLGEGTLPLGADLEGWWHCLPPDLGTPPGGPAVGAASGGVSLVALPRLLLRTEKESPDPSGRRRKGAGGLRPHQKVQEPWRWTGRRLHRWNPGSGHRAGCGSLGQEFQGRGWAGGQLWRSGGGSERGPSWKGLGGVGGELKRPPGALSPGKGPREASKELRVPCAKICIRESLQGCEGLAGGGRFSDGSTLPQFRRDSLPWAEDCPSLFLLKPLTSCPSSSFTKKMEAPRRGLPRAPGPAAT